ncbi:MAG: NB-ARC domain-containing protein, partial [Candidatus Wallbacteria bacterium]|nr:NB-ARC domain-containing protein [Candidatus Wallbacteria bacterium]
MHGIPTPPGSFCGREADLEFLNTIYHNQKIVIIAGIGGMGKTSLAAAFAGLLQREEGSKSLWISCKSGWNSADLMGEIVQQVFNETADQECKSATGIKPQLIVELIEKHGFTLFIDDFHYLTDIASEEILSLGLRYFSTGKIIVITRVRPSLPVTDLAETGELILEGLIQTDAENLLNRLFSSHSPKNINENTRKLILSGSKGHPYSLKLMAALLINGRSSVEALAGPESAFKEKIEFFLLEELWTRLDEPAQEILKTLSLLRIPSNPEFLSNLAQDGIPALEKLIDCYFIESDQTGKLLLHDLLREHICGKMGKTEQKKRHHSIAMTFSSKNDPEILELREAYYHFHESGEIRQAVDTILRLGRQILLLADETENFYHLLNDALATCEGYRNEELINTKVGFLIFWSKHEEAEALADGIKKSELKSLALGQIRQQQYRFPEAIQFYQDALPGINEPDDQIEIRIDLAFCLSQLGKIDEAHEVLAQAEKLLCPASSPLLRGRCAKVLANIHLSSGNCPEALRYFEMAEAIYRRHNVWMALASVLYSTALINFSPLKDYQRAFALADECETNCRKSHNEIRAAFCLNLKASIKTETLNFTEALSYQNAAIKLSEANGFFDHMHHYLINLATIQLKLENHAEAAHTLQKALQYAEKFKDEETSATCHLLFAELLLIEGQHGDAASRLETALEIGEKISSTELLFRC